MHALHQCMNFSGPNMHYYVLVLQPTNSNQPIPTNSNQLHSIKIVSFEFKTTWILVVKASGVNINIAAIEFSLVTRRCYGR